MKLLLHNEIEISFNILFPTGKLGMRTKVVFLRNLIALPSKNLMKFFLLFSLSFRLRFFLRTTCMIRQNDNLFSFPLLYSKPFARFINHCGGRIFKTMLQYRGELHQILPDFYKHHYDKLNRPFLFQ